MQSHLLSDNYIEIARWIDTGTAWKQWIGTCRAFADMNTNAQVARFSNHLITLLKLYPDHPWNWSRISSNPNITFQIIRDNPDRPWNWNGISSNPSITFQIVRDNPDRPWNWRELSSNLFTKYKK